MAHIIVIAGRSTIGAIHLWCHVNSTSFYVFIKGNQEFSIGEVSRLGHLW